MDRKQQAARIQKIVDTIAERSIAVPPEARLTYIQEEVAKVREAFRHTYKADARLAVYAMEFVDHMAEWIAARVHSLETEAGEGRTGLES
jgi:hypothetical protein